ncbi:MAG: beta-class carbonic anhydrase [Actinomycetota bacterium]
MSALEDLVEHNRKFAAGFDLAGLAPRASKGIALLTCIDSRIEPVRSLGLEPGNAKILRNAGGRATPDATRSLAIAVATLGVRHIIVMHHTECAMSTLSNSEIRDAVAAAGGSASKDFDFFAIDHPDDALRADVQAIRGSALIPPLDSVVGWIYDVRTGLVAQRVGPSGSD